jgi:GH15 family glucan-1,4-alpha-glucosidase
VNQSDTDLLFDAGALPIGEYAVIGDCRGAGLVSREGSLDWLCLPRFDSPSIFAGLLDRRAGGRFSIRPLGKFRTERRYLPGTNILETTFHVQDGTLVLRDLMSVSSEVARRASLRPGQEVLRELEAVQGTVAVSVQYEPRPDYGRSSPMLEQRRSFGIWGQAGGAALILNSDVPLEVTSGGEAACGYADLRAGERRYVSLSYAEEAPAVIPALGVAARQRCEQSVRWWQEWAARCKYGGPYREAVVRSALTLKLLAFAPSGAVVAAPTTSLPEKLGGVRNWDYRYCWLRDASFTVRALFALGYSEEAEAFLSWMLHATRLTWPELQVVYDVFGEAHLPERSLAHLEGYAGSRPVRTGNDAHGQLQLDVYGEVIDAVAAFVETGRHLDRDTSRLLDGLGRTVCKRWHEPDEGIWEARSERCQHTHSKVLCWVALDRLIRMHEAGQISVRVAELRAQREAIRTEIESRGYNEHLGSYTAELDRDDLDASLLTLPLYGYVEASDPRMLSTLARVFETLGRGELIYRYPAARYDGLPAGEGAFGICSFWAVECLARSGRVGEASRVFERLLGYANDVGLFAEEIDTATGAALGNFPQAFTHIGLINAALAISAQTEQAQISADRLSQSAEGGIHV